MSISIHALNGIPRVQNNDNLVELIIAAMDQGNHTVNDGDIIVIAQKIVSKSEGRLYQLSDVTPSNAAIDLGLETGKDPRLVQLLLDESKEVIRKREGIIIVEHNIGLVHANAGIDRSNIESEDGALLLPIDPDRSAATIRQGLERNYGVHIGVIISDSMGRAWRTGTVGFAIGSSGVETVQDLVGQPDMFGRILEASSVGHGDELAAAASIIMGQANEAIPVALIQGLPAKDTNLTAANLIRDKAEDLFR